MFHPAEDAGKTEGAAESAALDGLAAGFWAALETLEGPALVEELARGELTAGTFGLTFRDGST